MEILRRGGGILSTVRATRAADKVTLVAEALQRLDLMLVHGTTTVEAKSGYGLTVEDELKSLEVMRILQKEHAVDLVPTFLGAHAVPPEYCNKPGEYIDLIISEMLPEVARGKLAEFCDVFCEEGVFSVVDARRLLKAAKNYGLKVKLHADEMVRLGGAELSAELGAISADHLLKSSEAGITAMAEGGVIGVLLPATPFALMQEEYANARAIIDAGVPVALATDLNPNCWVESMQFIIALACYKMRMEPAEALVASTINAAHAVGRGAEFGSLEIGKKCDLIILDVPNHLHVPYHFGVNLVDKVVKNGRLVVDNGKIMV
jgi:imidazolonepropionase